MIALEHLPAHLNVKRALKSVGYAIDDLSKVEKKTPKLAELLLLLVEAQNRLTVVELSL